MDILRFENMNKLRKTTCDISEWFNDNHVLWRNFWTFLGVTLKRDMRHISKLTLWNFILINHVISIKLLQNLHLIQTHSKFIVLTITHNETKYFSNQPEKEIFNIWDYFVTLSQGKCDANFSFSSAI